MRAPGARGSRGGMGGRSSRVLSAGFAVVYGLMALLLAGCTTAPPASASPAAPLQVAITLSDGKVDPSGAHLDVALGQTVVLTVTSDRDDEIHVHGFDLEFEVHPGTTTTREFVADKVGRYEVESHEPPLQILQLAVR